MRADRVFYDAIVKDPSIAADLVEHRRLPSADVFEKLPRQERLRRIFLVNRIRSKVLVASGKTGFAVGDEVILFWEIYDSLYPGFKASDRGDAIE
jgi:hypothetical protein